MHRINRRAVAAMRKWHRYGCPGVVESAELMRSGAVSGSDWLEMAACAETFDRLGRENPEAVEAVRGVYMAGSSRGGLRKGEISSRVLQYCSRRSVCEREVWRLLAQACRLFDEYMSLSGDGERRVFE